MIAAPGFRFEDYGTIVVIRALDEEHQLQLQNDLQTDPWQWLGDALCVDRRLAPDVAAFLRGEEL